MSSRTLPGQGRTRAGHCPRHAADTPDRHGHGTIDRVRVSGQAGAAAETQLGMTVRPVGAWVVDFTDAPDVGHVLIVTYRQRQRRYALERVTPYTRATGHLSCLLHWRDEDGQRFTSGLRSKSLTRGDRRVLPGGAVPGGTQTAKFHALQDF